MKFLPIIGLEIHIQLNTQTKLFCHCLNEYCPETPNKNICPFCTGQPGALPSLNKEAVRKAIRFGVAVGGQIPSSTRWDRKNYFYPDLPCGYQISQYDNPIIVGGRIDFWIEDKTTGQFQPSFVTLTRAHLEADAGKMLHVGNQTLIDFNRSGAPLIEVVTEPCIHSSQQAMAFVNELQLLVRRLDISNADMEKGQMRFDCNLSLLPVEDEVQSLEDLPSFSLPKYRVETKNINSVRALGRSIEYEIERQKELLEAGQTPTQETRGWRDEDGYSVPQRSKEDAMDYRYFPEPDLKILEIRPKDIPTLESLPELPNAQRSRYMNMGLSIQIANTLVSQDSAREYFEEVLALLETEMVDSNN